MNRGLFKLIKTRAGFHFTFVEISQSFAHIGKGQSEVYTSKQNCHIGITSVKANSVKDDRYTPLVAQDGSFYFTIKAHNDEIVFTSRMWKQVEKRDQAIDFMKNYTQGAEIKDYSKKKE